jgi:hypothetical protein
MQNSNILYLKYLKYKSKYKYYKKILEGGVSDSADSVIKVVETISNTLETKVFYISTHEVTLSNIFSSFVNKLDKEKKRYNNENIDCRELTITIQQKLKPFDAKYFEIVYINDDNIHLCFNSENLPYTYEIDINYYKENIFKFLCDLITERDLVLKDNIQLPLEERNIGIPLEERNKKSFKSSLENLSEDEKNNFKSIKNIFDIFNLTVYLSY